MENNRTFPKRSSAPSPSLHAVAADQTPHYVPARIKVGSRSEVPFSADIYTASGIKLRVKLYSEAII